MKEKELGMADKLFLRKENNKKKYLVADNCDLIIGDEAIYLKFSYAGNTQYHKIDPTHIDHFIEALTFAKEQSA